MSTKVKDRIVYGLMILTILAFFACMIGSYVHFKSNAIPMDNKNVSFIEQVEEQLDEQILQVVHHDSHINQWKHYHTLTDKRLLAIMEVSNPKLTDNKRVEYLHYIKKYASKYNLSPVLVGAIIHRETNFRQNLVSSVGAKGCMQVFPKFHREKMKMYNLKERDLFNIQYGIKIGCMILDEYIKMENGNIKRALCRYVGSFSHGKYYTADVFKMVHYANKIN